MSRVTVPVVFLAVAACGENRAQLDAPPADTADIDAPDPNPLVETGLCTDAACTQISPGVIEYRPRFELWADTATKRRWVQLPAGTKIDTTNMDRWVFPVGTKLWKEFTRDGTRVETRFITKTLPDDDAPLAWQYFAFEWNATQDNTVLQTNGVEDANGTPHDIPSRQDCRDCHDSLRPTRVLGFGAIQLDDADLPFDLEDLIAGDLLTAPPLIGTPGDRFPIPGVAAERDALGYMHANCGHCHNPQSGTHDMTPVELLLETTLLATVDATPAYTTAVDKQVAIAFPANDALIVASGDPDASALIVRMSSTNELRRMPFRGSEMTDPDGLALLRAWIEGLD